MSLLIYFLALIAAYLGGAIGVLTGAAALFRLEWHGLSDSRLYSLDISSGSIGHIQRTFIAFARAITAFVAAKLLLSAFAMRLTVPFAALVIASFAVGDVYCVIRRERQASNLRTEDLFSLRTLRVALSLNVVAGIMAAWLIARES